MLITRTRTLILFAGLAIAQPPFGGRGGLWRRNAYFGEAQTFDACLGHQPPTAEYHYHANPTCLREQLKDNIVAVRTLRTGTVFREKSATWSHSPILGWALDGNPIYGPYGYSDPRNSKSPVKRMRSSFRLRAITARTSLPEWSLPNHPGSSVSLKAEQYGPPIDPQFPLGRYLEDFEFAPGFGDLDVYNGRQEVTPNFPAGTYAYHVTIDDEGMPAFPYIIGGEYYGAVSRGRRFQLLTDGIQDYFDQTQARQPSTVNIPLLNSWLTKNSWQSSRVTSGYDPSAGPSETWPTNAPRGTRHSGGASEPLKADIQRLRFSDTSVYVSANGLASYVMGPWFEATMDGGVFDNFPGVQKLQMQFPRTPTVPTSRTATGMGAVGLWVNGVGVFNFLDGATYNIARGTDDGGGRAVPTAINRSTASSENGPAAPGSLISAHSIFGATLASTTAPVKDTAWPTTLGGTTVFIQDAQGVSYPATIQFVSPTRIDYRLPTSLAPGFATATIAHGNTSYVTNLNILATYPHLFQADSSGTAMGQITRTRKGKSTQQPLTTVIDLGPSGDQVELTIFGTGMGAATEATASIGRLSAAVQVNKNPLEPGREQFKMLIPRSLAGKGTVQVMITAAGRPSNAVNIKIQ